MTEEVFSEVMGRLIGGIMAHDQFASYYDFLSLRGYKRFHEWRYKEECCNYRKLQRYFINKYNRLIPETRVDDPGIIPESWYRYSRQDVDMNTKKNAVKAGIEAYVEWEKGTLEVIERAAKSLQEESEDITAVCFMEKLAKCVERELKYAQRKHIDLMSTGYDITYILQEQTKIHDKYKKKL